MELLQSTALSPELLAEIRRLHFHTRQLANQGLAGQYRSAFKGRGIEFEEVREYSPGDDIRTIDWKVTARSQKPFIKSYREERELTVMIAVDVSASTLTGTHNQLRERLIAEVGALLTLIALRNNDQVGLLTYSDKLETFHPPRKARGAVWRILHEVLAPKPYGSKTNLKGMLEFLSSVLKRSSIVFVLSDFFGEDYEKALAILSKRHDVTALPIVDPLDTVLPNSGLLEVLDPESQQRALLDTSSEEVRKVYRERNESAIEQRKQIFRKHRVGELELKTGENFLPIMRKFFTRKSSQLLYQHR